MGKTSKALSALLIVAYCLLPIAFPPAAHAASWTTPCVAKDTDVATLAGLECAFTNIVSVALALSSIIIFIMFVVGGFKYLTAGGDPKAVEGARATLTHAVAGVVVLVLAFVVLLLIHAVTGVDVTKFRVTTP